MSDLIRRQDAIDALNKAVEVRKERNNVMPLIAYANRFIREIPSADRPTVDKEYLIDLIQEAVYDGEACEKLIDLVDRPTGEWIYLHGSIGSYMTISCPFCGETFNDVAEWKYHYCPNCGAKMEGMADV